MFEKFTAEGAADFRQRYEGTFGFFKGEDGKRMLTKLTSIREMVCTFQDARGVEYKLYPDSKKDIGFVFIPPKAAYYNTAEGARLVQRVAARQFQRGLSAKNTHIYKLSHIGLERLNVDFEVLDGIYLKSRNVKDAYARFDELESVAISSQIAMSNGKVYLYEDKIGTFAKAGSHITVKLDTPDLWKTEIKDALRNLGTTFEVA